MELVTMSRVIVEISPTAQSKVTKKLIELGAVMRRFSARRALANAPTFSSPSNGDEVVIEAVIDAGATNSVVQALSEVCGDDSKISISIASSDAPLAVSDLCQHGKVLTHRGDIWGSYLLSI